MANEQRSDQGGIYHIRVQGTLDDERAGWFDGFVITARANGQTLLTGPVVDQGALYGVLGKIRGLGLPLLLVAQADCPCSKTKCPRRGHCIECAAYHAANGKLPYCHRRRRDGTSVLRSPRTGVQPVTYRSIPGLAIDSRH